MTAQRRTAKRLPREAQLVSEWAAIHYPNALVMTRVKLGNLPAPPAGASLSQSEARAFYVWRRWADAVIVDDRETLLVEGKIRPDIGVISQLELYQQLAPVTPELDQFKPRPIIPVLLVAVDDPHLAAMANAKGFRYVVFRPAWIDDYLSQLYPRERRAKGST